MRARRRELELGNGSGGSAPCSDFPVAPGVSGYPGKRVFSVRSVQVEWKIIALGSEAAARVLDHDRIPTLGAFFRKVGSGTLVVRCPQEDCGKAPLGLR